MALPPTEVAEALCVPIAVCSQVSPNAPSVSTSAASPTFNWSSAASVVSSSPWSTTTSQDPRSCSAGGKIFVDLGRSPSQELAASKAAGLWRRSPGSVDGGSQSRGGLRDVLEEKLRQLGELQAKEAQALRSQGEHEAELQRKLDAIALAENTSDALVARLRAAESAAATRKEEQKQQRRQARESDELRRWSTQLETIAEEQAVAARSEEQVQQLNLSLSALEATTERRMRQRHTELEEQQRRFRHLASTSAAGRAECELSLLRQELEDRQSAMTSLRHRLSEEAVTASGLSAGWTEEAAAARDVAIPALQAEMARGAVEMRRLTTEQTLCRLKMTRQECQEHGRPALRSLRETVAAQDVRMQALQTSRSSLKDLAAEQRLRAQELAGKLARRQASLQSLEQDHQDLHEHEEAVWKCEARVSALTSELGSAHLRSTKTKAGGLETRMETTAALEAALRILGYEDASICGSHQDDTDVMLQASMFETAARDVRSQLDALLLRAHSVAPAAGERAHNSALQALQSLCHA
eukprot:TRINITY_DN15825_c0_g1_i1.p1 TRINITY_DN15825_c0_g1~~TRINITY_DN15825_c0_g1_i1.p1  ORF type:complete len:527 (-),score=148.74 TRINITY_DN15825_c0_g1_i1:305-1885(-)